MSAETPLLWLPPGLPPSWLARLDALECERVFSLEGLSPQRLAGLRGLLSLLTTRIDAALLERLPGLRVVSNLAVGYDNIELDACARRGVEVGHTPGVLTDASADLAVALLLSAARLLPQAAQDAREGRWPGWTPTGWLGLELRGATVGIVGLGKIGYAVAERLRAFGARLVYAGRRDHPEAAALGAQRLPLPELLRVSEVVTLHVALTPETHGLIDAAAFAQMKPGAILVNTARGAVVDQDALLAALRSGRLGAAALDVCTPEPLPPEHPLFAEPRCLISPHIGSATTRGRQRMAELACENLIAGVREQPLVHAVALPPS